MNQLTSTHILRLVAASLLALSSGAMADAALDVELKSFRVVTAANGASTLAPFAVVKPGDVIEYQATYRNTSDAPLRGLVTTLPIPAAGVSYIAGTASPAGASASLDGRNYAPAPLQRVVVDDAGVQAKVPVPGVEYRALRWTWSQLGAGETQVVSARVRVDSPSAAKLPTN